MEALYESLLTLEVALVNAAVSGAGYFCEYIQTVTDPACRAEAATARSRPTSRI
jgi:hypothetical protein